MRLRSPLVVMVVGMCSFLASPLGTPSSGASTPVAGTFVVDGQKMAYLKAYVRSPQYQAAKENVIKAGDRHLADPVLSVMEKPQTPPSGTKHDYMSLSPYYWPNPNTASGLPYVVRDGHINPEFYTIADHDNLNKLTIAVGDLSAAYYFTDQTRYSDKAAAMIRTWFINSATRMNPNLQYTAVIKGVNNGDFPGIIEGSYLYKIVDAIKILQLSPSWTASDQAGFLDWSTRYYTWLTTSSNGRQEAAMPQNHGTFYHVQLAAFAEFSGNHAGAVAAINRGKAYINSQIRSDGYQPLEMARTRPWNYSTANLTGLISLAQMGERENIDLWNYVAPNGGSIRKAINFLRPYANGSKAWRYPDLDGSRPWLMTVPLRQAATAYHDRTYTTDAIKSLQPHTWPEYTALIY
jgi:Alginate lyase